MDFVSARLVDGRWFRTLTELDLCTRESLALVPVVAAALSGRPMLFGLVPADQMALGEALALLTIGARNTRPTADVISWMMTTIIPEIRHAFRLIRRNRGFALAVLLSTALGVGATASIFSLIDAFLLRPLPVPATGRVVRLTSVTQSSPVGRFSYREIDEIEQQARLFEGLATAKNAVFGLSQGPEAQPRVTLGVLVNGTFFSALGVRPALGRVFTPADDQAPGRSPVTVISYGMWQRDFGGRSDVVGRSVRLNAIEFTIVGVAPEWFTGVHPFFQPALYVPRMMIREATGSNVDVLTDRTARSVDVFARLTPGVTIEQARDEMRRLAAAMERDNPVANKGRGAMVFSQVGYRIAEAPDNFTLSWLFFAVAALVLSIACINVANLLLSTAPSRVRETAVRLAMGASRTRLLRQFLIESAVLSIGGAILGLGIAAACARFIRSIEIASDLPLTLDARVDLRVVLFALAVGLTSGVLAGLLPAIRSTRAELNAVLKATELRFARSRGWTRQALVVAQVAVALVMMVLSGLFLESIRVARDSDPGFRVDHVLTMGFDPRIARYDLDGSRRFYRQLLTRVRALPGVRTAALGQHIPLGVSSSTTDITIPLGTSRAEPADPLDRQLDRGDQLLRGARHSDSARPRVHRPGRSERTGRGDRQRGHGEEVLAEPRRPRSDGRHSGAAGSHRGGRRRGPRCQDA